HFPVLHKFAGESLRSICSYPDDSLGALFDGPRRASTAHIGADPAWADGVHRELRQRGRQLRSDSIQCRFRNAINRRPTIGFIMELSAAARDINNPRSEERRV